MNPEADPLLEQLLTLLERVAPRPLSIPELARRLELERYDHRGLARLLDAQVALRKLRRLGKTRYQWLRPIDVQRMPARDAAGGAGATPSSPSAPSTARAPHGARAPRTERASRAEGGARESRSDARRERGVLEGRYTRTRQGFGFVAPLDAPPRERGNDVFVPAGMEGDALHGDVVEVRVVKRTPPPRRGFRPGPPRTSGEVVRVVRRALQLVVGTLTRGAAPSPWARDGVRRRGVRRDRATAQGFRLIPENDLYPVFELEGGIAPQDEHDGALAVARFVDGPSGTRGPVVALERILGDANDPEVQFLTIALEHGLRIEFPPDVVAEADALPLDPAEGDLHGREDLRAQPFVTIDGETARDFDDAVCLEELPGGGERLWVAIADVSHYVRPSSALDGEAVLRGTSVYFPDRAIPMLPERLSNELCSLKPQRDRLVMVACIDYGRDGAIASSRFVRAVIRSHARLTYTQVAAVLSDTTTPQIEAWRAELAPLLPQLARMRALMQRLLARRLANGSLDLDLPEALVDLSEEGRSVGVRLSTRNDAHRMIEEMMLEANQAVARFLEEHGVPFPYRIHEPPAPDDVDSLNEFLGPFGLHVKYEAVVAPRDLQPVLRAVAGHALGRVLSRQVLRALMQARYSTENAGHFGLAFSTYCHFTSPIRRYPDLLVHRQLGLVLDGDAARAAGQGGAIEALSVSSSLREREAVSAERAMLDLKRCEFMLEHLLEPEPAMIVGVAPFGFFVELEAYPIEGLVRAEDLPVQVTFDDATQMLIARRSGERFRLGDRVLVEATEVSLARRQINFGFLERLSRGAVPVGAPDELALDKDADGGTEGDAESSSGGRSTYGRRSDAGSARGKREARPERRRSIASTDTEPRSRTKVASGVQGGADDGGVRVKKKRKGQGQMKPRKRAKIGKRRRPSR
jgi:ribonuclease R